MNFGITAASPVPGTESRDGFIRRWLIALIREAVRAEVELPFASLESRTAQIQEKFSEIAVRVKERQEEVKKAQPSLGKQWGARARELEMKSAENNG